MHGAQSRISSCINHWLDIRLFCMAVHAAVVVFGCQLVSTHKFLALLMLLDNSSGLIFLI